MDTNENMKNVKVLKGSCNVIFIVVCKIPLLARRTRSKAGRPSAARDDRVSCIQYL